MVVAVGNDAQFAAIGRQLDEPALSDGRFATNAGRLAHRTELVALIAARIATRSVAHWVAALSASGIPSGAVRRVRDVLDEVAGSPLSGIPPQAPGMVRRPPPRLDEHGTLVRTHAWDAFAHAG
jgi:crotonobetainyl-CoA:carnitine CoA-transferase CaiB-like acyl-CoA transferase